MAVPHRRQLTTLILAAPHRPNTHIVLIQVRFATVAGTSGATTTIAATPRASGTLKSFDHVAHDDCADNYANGHNGADIPNTIQRHGSGFRQ